MQIFDRIYIGAAIVFSIFCAILAYFISPAWRPAVGIGGVVIAIIIIWIGLYRYHKNKNRNKSYNSGTHA